MSAFSDKAKSIIATIAPVLGTAFGGPLGALAGNVLSNALGGADPKAVESAVLSGDPEVMLKIKQAELDFQAKLKQLEIQEEQLSVDDRKSARDLAKTDYWTPRLLAVFISIGFFGVLAWMLAYGKPTEGGDALLVMLGSLGTAWVSVVSFYFGSSAGSARKTEIMGSK